MFIDLFGCIIMFVCFSVFPALLVFLFAFLPKLGCINVLRVYLRIVHSLNINVISIHFTQFGMLTMITQRQSTGGKEKMSTNVKFESTRRCLKAMNSAQGRQKINPSVP